MSKQTSFKKHSILGTEIDVMSIDEATRYIVEYARAPKNPAAYVVKPYVEHLQRGHDNPAIRSLLNKAELALPEGVSTQWASTYLYGGKRSWWRAAGLALSIVLRPRAIQHIYPDKLGGTVFTWKLLKQCADEGVSVYIVGSPLTSTLTRAAGFIHQRVPKLKLVGTWPGELGGLYGADLAAALPKEPVEQELVRDLKQSKPDIILVAMGFPLQEMLSAKLVNQLSHGVCIGEGGTFDYDSFGGKRRKAPWLFQHSGLEWLWRLLLEPSRWRRQLAIPRFMWTIYQTGKHR